MRGHNNCFAVRNKKNIPELILNPTVSGALSPSDVFSDAAAVMKDRLCKDFGRKLRRQDKHTGR